MAADDRYDFDHVALASSDTSPALRFLTGRLGGTVLGGGQSVGLRPMQVFVGDATGDGMAIELLEPWQPEHNDFLARFVARRGEGPHHMTFKVPNLMDAVERARQHGLQPVKIDVSDPQWKEAFLMPADAHGTVVQLAESTAEFATRAESLAHVAANGANGHPRWWVDPEPPEREQPAKLRFVVLRSPDAARAVEFFAGFLHGDVEHEREGRIELLWPKRGARVAIEQRDGASPGVDRLEVEGLDTTVEVVGARFVPPRV
jgi:catechol 2,3-dioxygenase-like lactoylglutathione lyase family enzyme